MSYPSTVPELKLVKSSNVYAIGYDPFNSLLYVKFLPDVGKNNEGPLYRYYAVPESVYEQFLIASSKGEFVWNSLRDRYKYAKWMGRGWKHGPSLQKSAARSKYWKQKTTKRLRK